MKNKKGFTIVELVIVIAVIAILAATLIPTFSNIIKKANISSDTQIIRNANMALASERAENKKHVTMTDALNCANEIGIDISKFNAKAKDNEILWDSQNDVFCYYNSEEDKIEYLDSSIVKPSDNKIWQIIDITNANPVSSINANYSLYARSTTVSNINVTNSFDCGKCEINQVSYSNNGQAKDIVLCSNSASTNLIIDAPLDNISHYGSAGIVKLQQVASSSYYEHGAVAFVELAIGRIVLTEASDVEIVYIAKKDANTYNNPIIADGGVLVENMPEIISRDQVDVTDASGKTPLVQVQKIDVNGNAEGTVEQVYAYANGTTGTTEKTTEHNSTISSTLGLIVLDGNGKAGEKAYSETTKEEKSNTIVQEKIDEEVQNSSSINYVARIGIKGYETLSAAVKAAKADNTVVLLNDVNENITFNNAIARMTIDLNGNTWSSNSNTIYMYYYGKTLNIKGKEGSVLTGSTKPIYIYNGNSNIVTFTQEFAGKVNGTCDVKFGKGYIYAKGGCFTSTSKITIPNEYINNTEVLEGYNKIELLSSLNAPVCAIVNNNTSYYKTLDDALTAAATGGTVKVLKNFTLPTSGGNLYLTGEVTFDLNGHTVDLSNASTGIRIYSGDLIVKTSVPGGKFYTNWSGTRMIEIEGGSLKVLSGDFVGDGVNATAISGSNGNGIKGSVIIEGGTFGTIECNSACQTLTIKGGVFNGNVRTAYQSNTVVNITGGTFNKQICCNQSSTGIFNISGGTFNCYVGNGGTFNISGGTFNKAADYDNFQCILDKWTSNSVFVVTGGTFDEDITTNSKVTITSGYHWDATTMSVLAD